MRAIKIVGIVVAAVVGLLVVVLLAVWLLVDPNDYKERIAREMRGSTGRELTLSGPIRLSVFPWIALELGPASLGNPPGFGAEPFATVQRIALQVKLLPLLHQELRIARIEIDGLDLRLVKNAAGKGNWQDFGSHDSSPAPPSTTSTSSGKASLPAVSAVEIKDSRVSYQDLVAEKLNFELEHLASGTPASLTLAVTLTPSRGARPVELKFSAPALTTDLTAQTLDAPEFSLQVNAATLNGSVHGSRIIDAPAFTGAFKLDRVSIRDLMEKFGLQAPQTRDSQALTKLAAQGDFTYGANALAVANLAVTLDDSQLHGKVAVTNLETKALSFDLAMDHINLDRYRTPEKAAAQPAVTQQQVASGQAPQSGQAASDPFKTLQLQGTVSVDGITISSVNLTQLHVSLLAQDGLIHIAPATARLYGGNYSGDITLDDRGPLAQLKLEQTLSGVDMAALLQDFAKTRRVSGHGTVTTTLTSQGLGGDALLKTLNGHIAANVEDGAVEGVDLWFEVDRAKALIQKQGLPDGKGSGRTKFDAFKASADITNGIARTTDLNIASQNLRITGQGTTNLVSDAIDYQVKATLYKDAPSSTTATGDTLLELPLNITGTTKKLNVRPDLEAMAKARAQQELNKHKGEIEQKLLDKLKGVFK